jgi:hypothetical protein
VPHAIIGGRLMKKSVEEHELVDGFRRARGAGKFAALEKFARQPRTKESAAAGDDNFHGWGKREWVPQPRRQKRSRLHHENWRGAWQEIPA